MGVSDTVAPFLVRSEVERLAITEEHVIPAIDPDHSRQRLAFVRTQAVGDDPPRFFLHPLDAVAGDRMSDLVGAIRRCVRREPLPTGTEDVPHMKYPADDLHKSVADKTGFVRRCRQHRPIADALEGKTLIAADGQTDGRIDRDRDSAIPAASVAIYGVAVTHDVHRKYPVLVETAEPA